MKISISETTLGKNSNIKNYATNARKFLIDNVSYITLNHEVETGLLNSHDSMVRTVISELYQQAIVENKLGIFTLLDLTKVSKIPSWFLISWLDIDTLELQDIDKSSYNILCTIPEYREKILVDITPYRNQKTGKITDVSTFHSRLVRNMLSRSYYLFDRMWLSPTLIYLLTKFYSLIISNKIGKVYNLPIQEQTIVATVLAIYFTNNCADINDVINPMMFKMDFLSRNVDTKAVFKYVEEKYSVKDFNLQAVVDTIVELGPSRMKKFTLSTFFSMNTNLVSNQLMSLMSLEYPPYFTVGILEALSGSKSSMMHTLKNLQMRKEMNQFSGEIIKTQTFIHSLA